MKVVIVKNGGMERETGEESIGLHNQLEDVG